MDKQKKNLGAAAFLPLIVFLACYVGCGITFTLMGVTEPFENFRVTWPFCQAVH